MSEYEWELSLGDLLEVLPEILSREVMAIHAAYMQDREPPSAPETVRAVKDALRERFMDTPSRPKPDESLARDYGPKYGFGP